MTALPMADGTPATPGQATAAWWAQQVYDRKPGRAPGDAHLTAFNLYADHIDPPDPAPAGTRSTFETAVKEYVDGELAKGERDYVFLQSDYGPRGALERIATAAGVPADRFPFKTVAFAHADHVTARPGYTAAERLIWHAPGWVRPFCETGDYDDEGRRVGCCVLPKYHHEEPHRFVPYSEPAEVQP